MQYFAYGSNLDAVDLARWMAAHGFVGAVMRPRARAWLPDYEPRFSAYSRVRRGGVLDVQPALGRAVPGVLFEVCELGWAALDRKEGVAQGRYRRVTRWVVTEDGRARRAVTYQFGGVDRSSRHVPPSAAYVDVVRRGLSQHQLDTAPLERAAIGVQSVADPSAVFVYGRRTRSPRAGRLSAGGALEARSGWVQGRLEQGRLERLGPSPSLVLQGNGRVHGEVVRYAELRTLLRRLDQAADFPGYRRLAVERAGGHRRSMVWVHTSAGRIRAWTYVRHAERAQPTS